VVRAAVRGIVDGIAAVIAIAAIQYFGWREFGSIETVAVACLAIATVEGWLWLWRDALKCEPPAVRGIPDAPMQFGSHSRGGQMSTIGMSIVAAVVMLLLWGMAGVLVCGPCMSFLRVAHEARPFGP
jgi:hypothetical protein